ncbi:hypothetical protein ZHAS_00000323 [Anopheles sinensis]|uniref:Uncharacterized protein n=1 Tax=Anopheles sinensis TaxID=74873 RepID=A0A084VA31_ANOSI|nr:hypothetical protein ZHAS_00000323 [Anopheles sinensis]
MSGVATRTKRSIRFRLPHDARSGVAPFSFVHSNSNVFPARWDGKMFSVLRPTSFDRANPGIEVPHRAM